MARKELKIKTVNPVEKIVPAIENLLKQCAEDSLAAVNNVYLEQCDKVKITIKKAENNYHLEMKFCFAPEQPEGSRREDRKRSYKELKKSLNKSFTEIQKQLKQSTVPSEQSVKSFLELSEQMISWKGFGDQHYDSYISACRELHKNFLSGNLELITESINEIKMIKASCHRIYK